MADVETLTDEERAFYATLPEHLGKVRMARLVALVDALSAALAAETRSHERTVHSWSEQIDRAEAAEARAAEWEQRYHALAHDASEALRG